MTLYDLVNVVAGVVIVSGALLLYLLPAYPEKRKQKPLTKIVPLQAIEGMYRGVVLRGSLWWARCHEVEVILMAETIKFRMAFEDGSREWERPLSGCRPMTESEMLGNISVTDERFDLPEVSGFVLENPDRWHLWYIRYSAAEGRSAYLFADMSNWEMLWSAILHDLSAVGQAKFQAELCAAERKVGAQSVIRFPKVGEAAAASA